ncbi:hypothetical protein BH11PSE9_BH11PSE9_37900 [soil metagenome]
MHPRGSNPGHVDELVLGRAVKGPAGLVVALATLVALTFGAEASAAIGAARDNSSGPPAASLAIEHCVAGPALRIEPSSSRAMLDEDDRLGAREAFLARFPALQDASFAPSQIMLWHNTADEWVYIALASSPDVPGTVCFTATFSASEFGFTAELLRKYSIDGSSASRQP